MKTTKSMLVAMILALATMGYAQTETPTELAPDPDPQSITVALKAALQNRGMVYAMRTQLNPRFLEVERPLYCVPIKYNKRLVYITGCCAEWKDFFFIHADNGPQVADGQRMHLKIALTDARLVQTMHEQLSPAILRVEKPIYTVKVKYNNSTVFVFGNYNEWKWFFRTDIHSVSSDS